MSIPAPLSSAMAGWFATDEAGAEVTRDATCASCDKPFVQRQVSDRFRTMAGGMVGDDGWFPKLCPSCERRQAWDEATAQEEAQRAATPGKLSDRAAFREHMGRLCLAFGRSDGMVDEYFRVLEQLLTDDEFRTAVTLAIRKYRTFPRPPELVRLLRS